MVGIDFDVLGVSSDISGDKLQQLANAGQGKRLSAVWGIDEDAAQPFQASRSVKGLSNRLRDILARVPLCEIALDRDVTLEEVTAAAVDLDGDPLPLGDPAGFQLNDSRRLQVLGKACEKLRATGKRLQVSIACD